MHGTETGLQKIDYTIDGTEILSAENHLLGFSLYSVQMMYGGGLFFFTFANNSFFILFYLCKWQWQVFFRDY